MNRNKPVIVLPSYPAKDWSSLEDALKGLESVAAEFQVDIVDGVFAPQTSWPFSDTEKEFSESLALLAPYIQTYSIEIDCMVKNPLQYLDVFVDIGVRKVIIHYGSTDDYDVCLRHAKENNYEMGLAVMPTIELAEIEALLQKFAYVQVMGIDEVGIQGQPFAEQSVILIAAIAEKFPDMEIAVDGSVNEDTIPKLVAAGATRLAPGSAVIAQPDPRAAYVYLQSLANSQQVAR